MFVVLLTKSMLNYTCVVLHNIHFKQVHTVRIDYGV